jgi:hypothetical protein
MSCPRGLPESEFHRNLTDFQKSVRLNQRKAVTAQGDSLFLFGCYIPEGKNECISEVEKQLPLERDGSCILY